MHESSLAQFKAFRDKYLVNEHGIKIADVGSMNVNGTYRDLIPENWHYTGIDLAPGPNVDLVVGGNYEWKAIPSGTFDVLISGQTLEHVEKPWRFVPECVRVVKSGGLLWFCAPNTWDYHAHPKDCWRIWPDGMRALLEENAIEVMECFASGPDTVAVARKILPC